jgi:hypothetical protein
MPTATVNGLELYWEQTGTTGEALVLVHGGWVTIVRGMGSSRALHGRSARKRWIARAPGDSSGRVCPTDRRVHPPGDLHRRLRVADMRQSNIWA